MSRRVNVIALLGLLGLALTLPYGFARAGHPVSAWWRCTVGKAC